MPAVHGILRRTAQAGHPVIRTILLLFIMLSIATIATELAVIANILGNVPSTTIECPKPKEPAFERGPQRIPLAPQGLPNVTATR